MKANEVLSCTKEKAELGIECQSKYIDHISPALGAGRIEVACVGGHMNKSGRCWMCPMGGRMK